MDGKTRLAVVFASIHHGNTRRLANVLAEELAADLFSADDARDTDLSTYDVVGLGSGIYFGKHHHSLTALVDGWQRSPSRAFLFSTAGLPFLRRLQHTKLRLRVRRSGCQVLGEFCCRGWDTVGPLWLMGGINRKHPDGTDLDRARRFARELLTQLSGD